MSILTIHFERAFKSTERWLPVDIKNYTPVALSTEERCLMGYIVLVNSNMMLGTVTIKGFAV